MRVGKLWTRVVAAANDASVTYKIHSWAMLVWVLLIIPSWYLWRSSLFWILAVSIYANFVSHWSAWQAVLAQLVAGRAEGESKRIAELVAIQNHKMLDRIIEAVSSQVKDAQIDAKNHELLERIIAVIEKNGHSP